MTKALDLYERKGRQLCLFGSFVSKNQGEVSVRVAVRRPSMFNGKEVSYLKANEIGGRL